MLTDDLSLKHGAISRICDVTTAIHGPIFNLHSVMWKLAASSALRLSSEVGNILCEGVKLNEYLHIHRI